MFFIPVNNRSSFMKGSRAQLVASVHGRFSTGAFSILHRPGWSLNLQSALDKQGLDLMGPQVTRKYTIKYNSKIEV